MSHPDGGGKGMLLSFDRLVSDLGEAVKTYYGPRLTSLAVFGSVARGTPGPISDLDALIIADPLPRGRIGRVEEFEGVEASLTGRLEELKRAGVDARISPVFRTPTEVLQYGGPIFLDMTEHVIILHDRRDFLRDYLARLKTGLAAKGARRLSWRGVSYWDLGEERGDRDL